MYILVSACKTIQDCLYMCTYNIVKRYHNFFSDQQYIQHFQYALRKHYNDQRYYE